MSAMRTGPIRIGAGPLMVMIGGIASGKSTTARRIAEEVLGDPRAVIESDGIREMLFGDAARQGDPARIHGLGHDMARIRLDAGLPVIYDATNLLPRDRASLVALAKETGSPLVAVWVEATFEEMTLRNSGRGRVVPAEVVARMAARADQVRHADLEKEGFTVIRTRSGEPLPAMSVVPSGWNNNQMEGPFDVIGDIHGCIHTLKTLMAELGYAEDGSHPQGRTLVSVGDIVDRGAHTWDTWTYVSELVAAGRLLLVKGNHEDKQSRYLEKMAKKAAGGENPETVVADLEAVQGQAHGLVRSLREAIQRGTVEEWSTRAAQMRRLPNHLSLDGGRLLVCHGAARPDLIGRDQYGDKEAESWFLYGAPTGEKDERGFPVRADWQQQWDGEAFVVVGHSTVAEPRYVAQGGGSINVDTGCAFGPNGVDVHTRQPFTGKLTAVRWPEVLDNVEQALMSVPVDEADLA